MQIRGEAAITCGFMAGLATGLLFDGCFDSYINRFRGSGFSRSELQGPVPVRQETVAPMGQCGLDASKIKVILTKNGKIYHRSAGCKSLPQNVVKTSVLLASALKRGETPCPVCCPPTA